jgi:hypothetical protein
LKLNDNAAFCSLNLEEVFSGGKFILASASTPLPADITSTMDLFMYGCIRSGISFFNVVLIIGIITTAAASTTIPKKVNNPESALYVNIVSTSNGKLTINIPRTIMDSKEPGINADNPYTVFEDRIQNTQFKETTK